MLALDQATAARLLCIEWGAAFLGMVRPPVGYLTRRYNQRQHVRAYETCSMLLQALQPHGSRALLLLLLGSSAARELPRA
jgi:hypothetical protein